MTEVGDVVLIHSTGQGAAGWEQVVRALGERGRAAHAVELPSDPGLLAADYAERIREQVGRVDAPVVLAHSGAGPLLPAAARALSAHHQVWLAAWVPDPEASFLEDTGRNLAAAFNPDWIGKDPTEDDAVAAKDRTIRPGWQRRMARERLGVEPIELPTGHCPNVSQPRRLAELLAEVAERA
jgi:hypothetical protein